jgi:YHS domain-containing protein
MKRSIIIGSVLLAVGFTASTALACNCGKKSLNGNQVSACQGQCCGGCGAGACGEQDACSGKSVQLVQATEPKEGEKVEAAVVEVGNKICPVSGRPIGSMGEGVTYAYQGKKYQLCCAGCIEKFKADPEKYIDKIGERNESK